MSKLHRLFWSKLCFAILSTLKWHYRAAYWVTRRATDANLADLNRRAMQHGKL